MLHFVKRDSVVAGSGFGRVAFSCAAAELPDIEAKAKAKNTTVLTPLVSLDTPGGLFAMKLLQRQIIKQYAGKATVQVVILADPTGHEICFVGDEAFRQLSLFDPDAERLLEKVDAKCLYSSI